MEAADGPHPDPHPDSLNAAPAVRHVIGSPCAALE
jgi:hypothetical protein